MSVSIIWDFQLVLEILNIRHSGSSLPVISPSIEEKFIVVQLQSLICSAEFCRNPTSVAVCQNIIFNDILSVSLAQINGESPSLSRLEAMIENNGIIAYNPSRRSPASSGNRLFLFL